jgi:hypothetical protein
LFFRLVRRTKATDAGDYPDFSLQVRVTNG